MMKIAMPYDRGQINQHFGKSREFIIFDVVDGKITGSKVLNSFELCHNHEGLAGLLKNEGVEVVITGGVGHSMMAALQQMGFEIVTGASGDAARVAEDYVSGRLVTNNIAICGCGGEHGHHEG